MKPFRGAYTLGDIGHDGQPFSLYDINKANEWHPVSGHPKGWRVMRGRFCEHNATNGRLIIYKSLETAQRKADELNAAGYELANESESAIN